MDAATLLSARSSNGQRSMDLRHRDDGDALEQFFEAKQSSSHARKEILTQNLRHRHFPHQQSQLKTRQSSHSSLRILPLRQSLRRRRPEQEPEQGLQR